MTAEAILCRMYLGWKKDDPRLSVAVKWLMDDHLPSKRNPNLYYWYYGTQVMHHYGGNSWETWNRKMRELLISTQNTRSSNAGSWDPGKFELWPRGFVWYRRELLGVVWASPRRRLCVPWTSRQRLRDAKTMPMGAAGNT